MCCEGSNNVLLAVTILAGLGRGTDVDIEIE